MGVHLAAVAKIHPAFAINVTIPAVQQVFFVHCFRSRRDGVTVAFDLHNTVVQVVLDNGVRPQIYVVAVSQVHLFRRLGGHTEAQVHKGGQVFLTIAVFLRSDWCVRRAHTRVGQVHLGEHSGKLGDIVPAVSHVGVVHRAGDHGVLPIGGIGDAAQLEVVGAAAGHLKASLGEGEQHFAAHHQTVI